MNFFFFLLSPGSLHIDLARVRLRNRAVVHAGRESGADQLVPTTALLARAAKATDAAALQEAQQRQGHNGPSEDQKGQVRQAPVVVHVASHFALGVWVVGKRVGYGPKEAPLQRAHQLDPEKKLTRISFNIKFAK